MSQTPKLYVMPKSIIESRKLSGARKVIQMPVRFVALKKAA